jgi:hypothetical protein
MTKTLKGLIENFDHNKKIEILMNKAVRKGSRKEWGISITSEGQNIVRIWEDHPELEILIPRVERIIEESLEIQRVAEYVRKTYEEIGYHASEGRLWGDTTRRKVEIYFSDSSIAHIVVAGGSLKFGLSDELDITDEPVIEIPLSEPNSLNPERLKKALQDLLKLATEMILKHHTGTINAINLLIDRNETSDIEMAISAINYYVKD